MRPPPATQLASPSPEEKKKYAGKDHLDKTVPSIALLTAIYKLVFWGDFLGESAIVLAERFPSTASDTVLSLLSRSPAHAQHVRLTPAWLAGCALLCAGSVLRLACYRTLGRFFTWYMSVQKDHELVTSGPYSVVRHPSYLGSALIALGTALTQFGSGSWYHECVGLDSWGSRIFVGLWGSWWVYLVSMLISRIPAEDEVMRKEFGAEWEAWARRTPYKLIPYIY
ncbi:hypothetical protein PHLGIDRAFT_104140 [Phlebiopsis gigantea 11061_1 CR5-6]|uniref:Protein-S-isoprenylcysteine O-methyltransferase n=1 Tax=Phlebiopsis gigantea (strain 11061_1 CR5-6) TaxID=745531 RepID=A0A0C3PP25_PHLG1|nr:hypothetical protein PHLGIDRAFT_104140 [Phlebiopsis gigantea 11061_1 CR5-6]